MNLQELKTAIGNNTLPRYCIFYGEEQVIQDIYINQICTVTGLKKVICETVVEAVGLAQKRSLDNIQKLYMVSNDNGYQSAENKWQTVKNTFDESQHMLILRYSNINKKTKFYTQNKTSITEFAHMTTDVLTSMIETYQGMNLSQENSKKLCHICDNDYGRVQLECNKIKRFGKNHDEVFKQLLEQNIIYRPAQDRIFELTDSVSGGYVGKVLALLNEVKRSGEPPMIVSSVLFNNFLSMLQVQGCGKYKGDYNKVLELTGLPGWQIGKIQKQFLGAYSNQELMRNINICNNAECDLKSGKLDEAFAIDYIIISCMMYEQ